MKTINVIGCGRVGQTLARLLHLSGLCQIQDLKSAHEATAQKASDFIGAGRVVAELADMCPADIWILSVPDSQITQVSVELAEVFAVKNPVPSSDTVVFHCSGFFPASLLSPLRLLGWQLASVHPILTFASPAVAVGQFLGTPCGFEGDDAAIQVLQPLFSAVGAQPFSVISERKALYHAAAVFASNFTVVLQAIAKEAWVAAGMPPEMALQAQSSILCATVENVLALGSQALTGPAARGDMHVVQAQGAAVAQWEEHVGVVYRELSLLAQRLAQHQSISLNS